VKHADVFTLPVCAYQSSPCRPRDVWVIHHDDESKAENFALLFLRGLGARRGATKTYSAGEVSSSCPNLRPKLLLYE